MKPDAIEMVFSGIQPCNSAIVAGAKLAKESGRKQTAFDFDRGGDSGHDVRRSGEIGRLRASQADDVGLRRTRCVCPAMRCVRADDSRAGLAP